MLASGLAASDTRVDAAVVFHSAGVVFVFSDLHLIVNESHVSVKNIRLRVAVLVTACDAPRDVESRQKVGCCNDRMGLAGPSGLRRALDMGNDTMSRIDLCPSRTVSERGSRPKADNVRVWLKHVLRPVLDGDGPQDSIRLGRVVEAARRVAPARSGEVESRDEPRFTVRRGAARELLAAGGAVPRAPACHHGEGARRWPRGSGIYTYIAMSRQTVTQRSALRVCTND